MNDLTEKYILYVGGIGENIDKATLNAAFVPFGEIKSIDIPYDLTTRKVNIILFIYIEKPKGYGFVEFEEYDDCLHAIENMNDSELCGKVIHVSFAKKQKLKESNYNSNKPIWSKENYIKQYPSLDKGDTGAQKSFE